jgi:hypothetical protein
MQMAGMVRSSALDQQVAQRWQLDDGMPQQYKDVCAWQGFAWRPRRAGQGQQSDWPVDLATAFWRSSVRILTPDEAIEASIRFTPAQVPRYAGITPNLKPFTQDDLHAHYRAEGYSPVLADWHRALRVPEVPFRTILRLYYYQPNVWPQVERRLLRLGYLPSDVEEMRDLIDAQRRYRETSWVRSRSDATGSATWKAIEEGFKLGIYTDAQVSAAFLALGVDTALVPQLLSAWRVQQAVEEARKLVTQLRGSYMRGELSVQEAMLALQGTGMTGGSVQTTLARWQQARSWERRAASSSQILRWVARGMLTPAVATARLANLGWTAPDIALQLAEAEGGLAKMQATATAAQARAAQRAQRQLESVNKQHAAAITANQKRLKALTSLSDLKTWLTEGLASEEWVTERLRGQGYPDDEIAARLIEWQKTKKSAPGPQLLPPELPPAQSRPAPPPPSTTVVGGTGKVVGGTGTIPPAQGGS